MIDILIPTLRRSKALQPLAANIVNTTPEGSFRVIFVADQEDAETRQVLDSLCYPGGPWLQVVENGSYPHKINFAYWASAPGRALVAPLADDVVFHDGWLDAALNALEDDSVQVVGTDDLSPATASREHATMPILRRSYIEDPGAVWGERGTVFNEGYTHNFCETETWQLALHRGVTGWAADCVIEHLHPAWGKREVDETDRRGNLKGWDEDEALFRSRQRQWSRS
jgi:glycosyltransferase involved in cell wall biosynthesis